MKKQWESIVGNCDEFLYLGGNEQSTHKYVSELIGKETMDYDTYGKSLGNSGSYSTNYQIGGRELMTPDEVRMLDNKYAILFIRGERPIKDLKFDILKHPKVVDTADGKGKIYEHDNIKHSIGTITIDYDVDNYNYDNFDDIDNDYEIIYCEDMDEYLERKENENNEKK